MEWFLREAHLNQACITGALSRSVPVRFSKALYDNGLYCRADDRGNPVIQLAPPLIIGQPEFDEIEQILRHVLIEGMNIL